MMAVWLCSCAGSATDGSGAVDSSTSQASEGLTKFEGGYEMVRDEETGFVRPVTDKKSPFDTGRSPYSGQNQAGNKAYRTGDYAKRDWSGNTEYSRKRWKGKDRYDHSPEFVRQNSHYASQSAREGSSSYQPGSSAYQTSAATEQSISGIDRTTNYQAQKAQSTFRQPEIIQQHGQPSSGRTVEDVKGMLND